MNILQVKYTIKPGIISKPKMYLRSDIVKFSYPDGSHSWKIISDLYVKESVENVKTWLQYDRFKFNTNLSDPNYPPQNTFLSVEYRPELDKT